MVEKVYGFDDCDRPAEISMNEKIEEELEKQFPKGDKARGRALVLHAVAQIEFNELQKAFDIALVENNRLRKLQGGKK